MQFTYLRPLPKGDFTSATFLTSCPFLLCSYLPVIQALMEHRLWFQAAWVQKSARTLIGCATLNMDLSLSVPQFHHLENGHKDSVASRIMIPKDVHTITARTCEGAPSPEKWTLCDYSYRPLGERLNYLDGPYLIISITKK